MSEKGKAHCRLAGDHEWGYKNLQEGFIIYIRQRAICLRCGIKKPSIPFYERLIPSNDLPQDTISRVYMIDASTNIRGLTADKYIEDEKE